jgi:hypothetical protein
VFYISTYMSTDVVTMSKEMYKTHFIKHKYLRFKKRNKVSVFRKECNELLAIRCFILGVNVPLQLLVTAI